MASRLIAHVAAWYIPTGQPLVNDMDGLTIDGAYRLEAQRMHAELERRARGQPLCVEIDIRPVKNKRTLGSEPPHVGAAEQAGAGVERRHARRGDCRTVLS